MAFKKYIKIKSGADCTEFRPCFWNRKQCKLSHKCDFEKQDYIKIRYPDKFGRGNVFCKGILEHPKRNPLPEIDPNLIQYDKAK